MLSADKSEGGAVATARIPREMEDFYVDRPAEMEALRQFVGSDFPVKLFISGPPGIGKTWLVQWFFHSTHQRVPRLAAFSASRTHPKDIFARSSELRDFPAGGVLVVDDVNFATKHSSGDRSWPVALRLFFEAYPRAKAVLISREPASPAWDIPHARRLAIGPFTRAQFYDFVRRHTKRAISGITIDMLYSRLQGNPAVAYLAIKALERYGGEIDGHIASLLEPFTVPGILGPDGRELSPGRSEYQAVVTDLSEVSDYVLNQLSENPAELYKLSPRFFEQVIAEIFRRKGYEVTLTAASKDGGKDVYAARKDSVGTFLFLIECKKYSASHKVGVELVRSLYGVVNKENATAGILATTSHFTQGAHKFERDVKFRISLKNFLDVHKWLREVTNRPTI